MPIAAVPDYLGKDFKEASPGMRFGLMLPIWTDRQDQEADVRKRAEARSHEGWEVSGLLRQEGMEGTIQKLRQRARNPLPGLWEKNDFAARDAWKRVITLTSSDRERMQALYRRQETIAADTANLVRLDAIATAPFTTGLGNEHPLENGFAFLNPYGLPYLPASGVKGVLRQAARELASGEWGETHGWSEAKAFILPSGTKQKSLSALDVLFGLESGDGEVEHVRGVLSFWDVIPQIKGDSLMADIMTPHQSHYYRPKRDRKAGDSDTPHDSGQPTPISFLTVPPGSGFVFFVTCDTRRLARLAPDLAATDSVTGKPRWHALMTSAFEHAFQWLGFGAKTAVGYGAMVRDTAAEDRRINEQKEREAKEQAAVEREAMLAKLSPVERSILEFLDSRPDKKQSETSAVIGEVKKGRWQGADKISVAHWLQAKMRETKQWKETSQAKKPEKDKEFQNTQLVKSWLEGK